MWPTAGRMRKRAPAGRRSRLRRPDQAVELAPGDRHRDVLRVAARVEEVGRASPGWRRGSRRRLSSRAPARGPRRAGCARDGRRRSSNIASRGRAEPQGQRDERPRSPRPDVGVAAARAERPAPEAGGGEGRDRGGPALPSHFQRRPSRRGCCRRRGAARPRAHRSRALIAAAGWRRSARPRRAAAAPRRSRACRRRSPRARPRAARGPAPRPPGCRRGRGGAGAARRRLRSMPLRPGVLASSTWTSPIRRSRKPASEELR